MDEPVDRPPVEPGHTEAVLSPDAAFNRSIVHLARYVALQIEGVKIGSELITEDPAFGTIIRYDIVSLVENDGKFHPEDNRRGVVSEVRSKQIFFQKPGDRPKAMTIPLDLDF